MRRQTIKQGRKPRDIELVQRHYDRKRARTDLRQYRYLRMPRLYVADFALGAASGFGVLALAMLAVGAIR